jgi:F420-dependent oxidoreductase-like protein
MRVGLHPIRYDWPGAPDTIASILAATAEAAEEVGMTWFAPMDHYFQMEHVGSASDPMLEAYTQLGFLAGRTHTMTLGVLVTGVSYRYPGILAKIVTTLDVLSGGRAQLGIGAAWYEREHRGLGVPFPPVSERFERLEETLQICLQMWSNNNGPYNGRHYQLAETICSPRPIQQPRPSILIGGGGERKTLRLVARYADACNLFASGPAQVGHKLDVLRRHCENEGRPYDEIEKTIMVVPDPFKDVETFLDDMAEYAKIGIETVSLIPYGDPVQFTRRAGRDLIPVLADL